MLIEDAVSSGTPQFVIDSYATLAERAKTQSFGLIEEDVIVLDKTEGLRFGAFGKRGIGVDDKLRRS